VAEFDHDPDGYGVATRWCSKCNAITEAVYVKPDSTSKAFECGHVCIQPMKIDYVAGSKVMGSKDL